MGCSPINLHAINKRQHFSYVQEKYCRESTALKRNLFSAAGMDITSQTDTASPANSTIKTKAEDFDILMNELQQKLKTANRDEKLSLLTLKPSSWSIAKTEQFFSVSYYNVKEAMKLKQTKGILSKPDPIQGKNSISEDTKKLVQDFFLNPEYSRIMPGQKDFVSLGKKFMFKSNFFCATSMNCTPCLNNRTQK